MVAPTTSAHRTCSRAASRQAGRSSLPKATRARHRPTRSFCSAVRRHLHAFHPSARAGRARCRLRRRALSRCPDDAAYPPKPCRASQPQQRGSLRPARPEVSRTAQRQRSASFSVGTVASACLPMSAGHIFAPSHRWPHQQRPSSSTMHMPLPQQRGSSLIRFSLTFSPCYFTGEWGGGRRQIEHAEKRRHVFLVKCQPMCRQWTCRNISLVPPTGIEPVFAA